MNIKKLLLVFVLIIPLCAFSFEKEYKIQVFDSGFGGFFTAKAIEKSAHQLVNDYDVSFKIYHFGDTQNAPYGEKTPKQIGYFTAYNLNNLEQTIKPYMSFVACNTASTRKVQVNNILETMYPNNDFDIKYIISSSVNDLVQKSNTLFKKSNIVNLAILSTPATLKSAAYPKELANALHGKIKEGSINEIKQDRWYKIKGSSDFITSLTRVSKITLLDAKVIYIYQLAPANWVDLVEHGASVAEKAKVVKRDVALLKDILPKNTKIDGFGEFCTHYPVVDQLLKENTKDIVSANAFYILQGPLMANLFKTKMLKNIQEYKRSEPASGEELVGLYETMRPSIVLTGNNVEETRKLVNTVFHDQNRTSITNKYDNIITH